MKKAPILISLLVILMIAGFAYFRLVLSTSSIRSAYDAVPESGTLIFEFKNFSKTSSKLNGALYADDFKKIGFIERIFSQMQIIDRLFSTAGYTPSANNKILATLHLTQINDYNFLYIIEAQKIDRNIFKSMVLTIKEMNKVNERNYKDETIYEILSADKKAVISAARIHGLLILSENASLVEEALLQIKEKKSIADTDDFGKINELAGGDSDVLLFLNFKNLIRLEPLLVDGSKSSLIKNISMFSEWMETDVMFEQRSIIMNGYTLFDDPKNSWISQFTYKPASQLTLPGILSDRTALFMLVSNADRQQYFRDLKDKITESTKLKYISYFSSWTDNEWAFGINEPLNADWKKEVFLIVKNSDSLTAVNQLAQLTAFISKDSTVDYTRQKGRIEMGDALNDIYGKYLLPLENPYYMVEGNYTYFANDESTLNNLTGISETDRLLVKNIDYLNFSKNISTTSNLYLYINSSKLSELLNTTVSGLLLESLKGDSKMIEKFSPASVQFSYEENLFFTSAFINYRSEVQEKTNLLWKLNLDTTAATKSYYVLNHDSKESEIMLQDAANQLYLISRAGKIIWKKTLNQRIISDIMQVDFYNNGKLQYLFNTEKELFVVDREGNYVTNFPLRLPDNATAGLLLATYKDVNQHRIFIPCGNRIYGYELSGKPLQGWNPKNISDGSVQFPLQHLVFEGKDYLIALNSNSQIFLFDRKGDNRTEPVKLKESIKGALQAHVTETVFEIVAVTTGGNVFKINQQGSIKELKLNDKEGFIDFQYLNVAGTNQPEYVFIQQNKLIAYNDSINIALEINFPATIDEQTFRLDSRNKSAFILGIPSQSSDQTFLLKTDGTIFNNFAINGYTPFEVDRFSRTDRDIIATCDKNGLLSCYKLN
jgi:hypothetical protein